LLAPMTLLAPITLLAPTTLLAETILLAAFRFESIAVLVTGLAVIPVLIKDFFSIDILISPEFD